MDINITLSIYLKFTSQALEWTKINMQQLRTLQPLIGLLSRAEQNQKVLRSS